MLLGRISLVQCGLGQFTLDRTPWTERLGPSYSAPFETTNPAYKIIMMTKHLPLYIKLHLIHLFKLNIIIRWEYRQRGQQDRP